MCKPKKNVIYYKHFLIFFWQFNHSFFTINTHENYNSRFGFATSNKYSCSTFPFSNIKVAKFINPEFIDAWYGIGIIYDKMRMIDEVIEVNNIPILAKEVLIDY